MPRSDDKTVLGHYEEGETAFAYDDVDPSAAWRGKIARLDKWHLRKKPLRILCCACFRGNLVRYLSHTLSCDHCDRMV